MSFLNGFFSRYLRAAGVDASVVRARSEGFWSTPRRAFLIAHRSSPVLLRTLPYLCSVHRACKCTVTCAGGRGRGDALLLLGLGSFFRFYTDAALLVHLFLSGQVPAATSGVKRAAARPRPRLVKCVCFQKGLLRRRAAPPEAASPSRSDAASLSIVAGHRREPPCR